MAKRTRKTQTKADDQAVKLPPQQLKPWDRNPRKNDKAVDKVAASIEKFGFGAPILARREDLRVVAGHTRLKAALKLGLEEVPVRLGDWTEQEANALALADNKLGELAEWDASGVAEVLSELQEQDEELIKAAGFDVAEEAAQELDATPVDMPDRYSVIVDCPDEKMQAKLLEEMDKRGLPCRAMTF